MRHYIDEIQDIQQNPAIVGGWLYEKQLQMASFDILLCFVLKSMYFIVTGEEKLNFKGLPCSSRWPPGGCLT